VYIVSCLNQVKLSEHYKRQLLTKLSVSLEEISESLDNESIFQNRYVIYPLGSGMIIVILASGIGLSLWYVRNKKQKTTNNQISTRIGDAMLY